MYPYRFQDCGSSGLADHRPHRIRRQPSTHTRGIHPEVCGIKAGFRIAMVEPRKALFLRTVGLLTSAWDHSCFLGGPLRWCNDALRFLMRGRTLTKKRMIPASRIQNAYGDVAGHAESKKEAHIRAGRIARSNWPFWRARCSAKGHVSALTIKYVEIAANSKP